MTPGVMHTSRLLPHVLGVLLPFTWLVAADRRLECEVVKADGRPAANASVFFYQPPSVNGILAQPVFAVGKTDEKGRFSAAISQPEPVKVLYGMALALSADGEAGWLPFSGNAPNQEPSIAAKITVMPGGDFRARLMQPDGQPAAGVEVWVHGCAMPRKPEDRFPIYLDMGRLPGPHWKATTDADGRCVIRQVPQGASIYLAHADERFAQLPGMHEILMPKMPKADGAEHELKLVRPGGIRGRVILPDGRPAAHSIAQIIEHTPYVTAFSTQVLTDAQGGFVITQIPPSKYRLRFATQPPLDDEWIGAEKDGVEVKAGNVTDVGDLKVSQVAIVTAEVLNAETGAKIEEPVIIRLAAGTHALHYRSHRMTPEGYHPPGRDDDLSVNVADGERKTVQFKLKPVKPQDMIAGVVLNADGKPAEGASVLMMGGGGFDSTAAAKTKADGHFQFPAPPDTRRITLLAWDGDKTMSDPVDAKRGEPVTVKIRSGGFASVGGRIVDEQGKAIRNAKVTWTIMGIEYGFHPGPVPEEALTDADGRFSFPRLWTGSDHLIFFCSADGYGGAALRDEKLMPGQSLDLKITFKKADQSISGVLLQADGTPSSHASISAQGDGQPSRNQATTDAEGRFTINGLCTGNVSLRIYDPATKKSFYHRAKVPAENIRASWPSAEGMATGIVVDSAGKPMPDAVIEAWEYGVKAAANKQGRFALTGLRKGWFTAEVKATTADGTKIETKQRLKPGMSNVRVQMPPKTREHEPPPTIPLVLIGKPAADLQIATWINSEPLSAKAGGKVRILDFFGMQCAPCLAGFPKVQAFWETHRDKNIEVIAHGSDFYPVQEVREYLAKHPKLKFPIAIAGPTSSYARDYDIRGIPFYVVIDQAGKIVSAGHDWDAAAAVALKLIGE
jgi:thiol-disulfide isomerase/thioredoxin